MKPLLILSLISFSLFAVEDNHRIVVKSPHKLLSSCTQTALETGTQLAARLNTEVTSNCEPFNSKSDNEVFLMVFELSNMHIQNKSLRILFKKPEVLENTVPDYSYVDGVLKEGQFMIQTLQSAGSDMTLAECTKEMETVKGPHSWYHEILGISGTVVSASCLRQSGHYNLHIISGDFLPDPKK